MNDCKENDALIILEQSEVSERQVEKSFNENFFRSHPMRYFVYFIFYLQLFVFGFYLCTFITITK